jgi:hypothetical protein
VTDKNLKDAELLHAVITLVVVAFMTGVVTGYIWKGLEIVL